jgi:hypothetical protein
MIFLVGDTAISTTKTIVLKSIFLNFKVWGLGVGLRNLKLKIKNVKLKLYSNENDPKYC